MMDIQISHGLIKIDSEGKFLHRSRLKNLDPYFSICGVDGSIQTIKVNFPYEGKLLDCFRRDALQWSNSEMLGSPGLLS